ncbi:proline dehydrogenase [Coniosporium apollinis]|uniref:Proline dehydrogenase n=1 Tax=Coniosporium apollinis TaxID=61459 RepID=A0ABQ9NJ74_9PEZI|nr:proline dehydrogenase [Coniosporium apollinis]
MVSGPGLAVMRTIADSKSALLDPDHNPVLRGVLKPLIYDQFCAGTTKDEVHRTAASIRNLGFAGVILTYGRELQINEKKGLVGLGREAVSQKSEDIKKWRDGNLKTLDMLQPGDWLAIKYTGAGKETTEDLMSGQAPPRAFSEAMDAICERAIAQKCRIWIDAEQSWVQPTIDRWTFDIMRRYNIGSAPLVYNTIQAYLKESRHKLQHHLQLAKQEGWTPAVKLVRGAYIGNDVREKIHDTKAETDASYNGIVRDLLSGTVPGFSQDQFPKVKLFLAGHNTDTIRKAIRLAQDLSAKGQLKVAPEFGQLQGMADDIGCEIIEMAQQQRDAPHSQGELVADSQTYVPHVYKCLTWGSVRECMQYLVRRAVENQGATGRMKEGTSVIAAELWRRITSLGRRRDSL